MKHLMNFNKHEIDSIVNIAKDEGVFANFRTIDKTGIEITLEKGDCGAPRKVHSDGHDKFMGISYDVYNRLIGSLNYKYNSISLFSEKSELKLNSGEILPVNGSKLDELDDWNYDVYR